MARRASRAAYASDVSACFPARIAGLVLAVADAQSRGLEHFAPPRHRRRLRRSYRPRRLVGQRAAATDERSAKVAEDATTFLKDCAVLRNERARGWTVSHFQARGQCCRIRLRPAARIVCAVPRPQGSATSRTAGLARIHRAAIMPVTMAVAKTKIS